MDGCSDLVEKKMFSLDPLDPSDCGIPIPQPSPIPPLPAPSPIYDPCDQVDNDHDGITNCEERILGSNPNHWDTDSDGMPDQIELKWGTMITDHDSEIDIDFDSLSNLEEILFHTFPHQFSYPENVFTEYKYEVTPPIINVENETYCSDYRVSNISLMNTLDLGTGAGEGLNEVKVYFIESPMNHPEDRGNLYTGSFLINFYYENGQEIRNPMLYEVEISQQHMTRIEVTR
jgi:hypothetical protein